MQTKNKLSVLFYCVTNVAEALFKFLQARIYAQNENVKKMERSFNVNRQRPMTRQWRRKMKLQQRDLKEFDPSAGYRLLPMRLSTEANDSRKFGSGSGVRCYRQLMSRIWLERYVPCITGQLHDIRMQLTSRANDYNIQDELFMTGKVGHVEKSFGATFGDPGNAMKDSDVAIWNKHGQWDYQALWASDASLDAFKSLVNRGCRRIALFVNTSQFSKGGFHIENSGHIFAIIVTFNEDASSITDILWLNTGNNNHERATEVAMAGVAQALVNAMPELEQSQLDLMKLITLPIPPGYNLQQGEQKGYCQSWDSYLIYHVLALQEDPGHLFKRLLRLPPRQRQQMVVDFTNDLVSYQTPPTTLPVMIEPISSTRVENARPIKFLFGTRTGK